MLHFGVGGKPSELDAVLLLRKGKRKEVRLKKKKKFGEAVSVAAVPITSFTKTCSRPVCGELPWWLSSKQFTCQCRRPGFDPWVDKIPWGKKWQPIPVSSTGKSHGQRSFVGYTPWVPKRVRYKLASKQ